jgi:hypothetical protein
VNRATSRLRRLYEQESVEAEAALAWGNGSGRGIGLEIEEVVKALAANGEYETFACTEADLEAAEMGRLLSATFEADYRDRRLEDEFAQEYELLRDARSGAGDLTLTDEEVEALLGAVEQETVPSETEVGVEVESATSRWRIAVDSGKLADLDDAAGS